MPPSSSPSAPGDASWAGRWALPAARASSTSSTDRPVRSAISLIVGLRPFCAESSLTAWVICARASWMPRGTRTVHERSRKWRRISPRIVGVAKLASLLPRLGSKRSIALIEPDRAHLDEVVQRLAAIRRIGARGRAPGGGARRSAARARPRPVWVLGSSRSGGVRRRSRRIVPDRSTARHALRRCRRPGTPATLAGDGQPARDHLPRPCGATARTRSSSSLRASSTSSARPAC